MTRVEACRLLGIRQSANLSVAEQAFRDKQKKMRQKTIPGNTEFDRQKAAAELAKLTTAWHTLQVQPANKPHRNKPVQKRAKRPRSATVNTCSQPTTLGEAWEILVQLLPFSEPVIAILVIAVLLLTLTALVSSL